MSTKAVAALVSLVCTVALHPHLSITAAGLTISVSIPVALAVAIALLSAAGAWLAIRRIRSFRSSPYPRQVLA